MSKMTKIGDHVRCPECGGEGYVVWVSQDEETVAIRCMGYHSHDEKGPSTKVSSYYKTKPKKKAVKGMVFLIEQPRMSENSFVYKGMRCAHVYKKLPRSIGK